MNPSLCGSSLKSQNVANQKCSALLSFKKLYKTVNVAIIIVGILLLTGCSHHNVQGVSRSSKGYCVHGVWYYPQKFYDYDEVGIASWYGPGFHNRQKAQGEMYDQYAMTAAHKTLPLPTIVKVTNLENGKSIVVLVDDRGPYKHKRLIDLSASGAKELGIHDKGLGRVRIQALCKESNALAIYLQHHRKERMGVVRTWEKIYRQEVGCRPGYQQLTTLSSKVRQSNKEEVRLKHKSTKKGFFVFK